MFQIGKRRAAPCRWSVAVVWLAIWLVVPGRVLAELPFGKSRHQADLLDTRLVFDSYKPDGYAGGPLIVSFHGSERNAAFARSALIPLAKAEKVLVVAPKFDEERFPRWAYQFAGIAEPVNDDARTAYRERAPESWTGKIVLELVEHIRREERRPDLPYYLIGHSAGGQFLSRFAGFVPNEALRIVLVNPGSYLAADRSRAFPYGFGKLSPALDNDVSVRRYLASPITIFVGTEDLFRKGLPKSRGAELQGLSRYERGVNVFTDACATAVEHGWAFGWRFVEAPGVGHSGSGMYRGREARTAVFGNVEVPSGTACLKRVNRPTRDVANSDRGRANGEDVGESGTGHPR